MTKQIYYSSATVNFQRADMTYFTDVQLKFFPNLNIF